MVKRLPASPFWALLILLGGCGGQTASPQAVLEPTLITFADSGSQEVRFEAPVDQPVLVTLSGDGIDIRAAVLPGGNQAPAFADAPNRRMGIETLLVEAPHEPSVAIRIERHDNAGARGTVQVEAVALPVATNGDRERLAAARHEAAGCLAYPEPARGQESTMAFEAAAATYEAHGDRRAAGRALLLAAGTRYARLADWTGAADTAARAHGLLDADESAALAAFALRVEGAALDQAVNAIEFDGRSRAATLELARQRLTQAAERFRELGNDYEAGYALNYRGVSYQVTGERERAARDFRAALGHFQAAGDGPAQALSLQSLGVLAHEEGRLADAVRELDRALALIPRETDPENYAHTLHNSALPRRILGRFDEAVARYYEAGEILRGLGDRDGEARALHGLGTTLLFAGEPERAAPLLRSAVSLRRASGASREQAHGLILLGQIEREAGRAEAALELDRQALELVSAPHERAQALLALARDQRAARRPREAEQLLGQLFALPLPETHRWLGLAFTELAAIDAERGRAAPAREHFARAIRIHAANGSDIDHARALLARAGAAYRSGYLQAALADADAALAQFETVGARSLPAEHRAAYRASYREAIELRIASLVRSAAFARREGRPRDSERELGLALAASDRSRARLLAGVGESSAGAVSAGLIAERERSYALLAGKRQQRDRLLDSAAPDAARVAQFSREIELLRARALVAEGRIARAAGADPPVPAGAAVDPLAVAPRDELVAEYFIGDAHAWLFEVRGGKVKVHVLAPPAEIERLARGLHGSWRHAARGANDRLAQGGPLARLLFGALGPETPAALRIVPDGALHVVPMAILARQAWAELAPGSALIVPSLFAGGGVPNRPVAAPDRTLAVIADPVYSADDARVRLAGAPTPSAAPAALTRGAQGLQAFQRLPATAVEARELIALVRDRDRTLALLGPDASRARVVAAPLARYRIVHFATHALADSQDPALAMLALSRWDVAGRPIDGALRHYDIAQLRLNADLVVLSGCDTAVGREIAGEGPVGLSQAFLKSGARAVLATLWQVPDTSTAVLMQAFYRRMLVDGVEPTAALALAQEELRREPRWSDPYFWAGFQLVSNAGPAAGNNNVKRRKES